MEWHKYPEDKPFWDSKDNSFPIKQQPKWYVVKTYKDEIYEACWWLGHWYQTNDGAIAYWKEKE
jgi:hypothetical protein